MSDIDIDPALERTLEDLALIHEETLSHLQYLSIYALNYTYINFDTQKMVVSGTETDWLMHSIQQGLHQDLASRLKEFSHTWEEDALTTQAYTSWMQTHHADINWKKTDLGLKGKHGFHLLEIGHTEDLGIDSFNQMVDALNEFKYESIRLQKKYPSMLFDVHHMEEILQKQIQFAEEEQAQLDAMKIEFDESLFEPLEEPTLSEQEDQALSLRVQWYEDDEIAGQMQLPLIKVKQIFTSIKDKYHQPKIPQRVYLNKRKQLFPEHFATS